MADILDRILEAPGRARRLKGPHQAACRAFVEAVGYDLDFDDVVGVLAGIAIMFNARRSIPAETTMARIRMIARDVETEWQRRG